MILSHPKKIVIAFLCGITFLSGCSVCQYARLTSVEEPKVFNRKKDREISMATYRSLADEAWAMNSVCCPDDCTFSDYQYGFREGFAEFVYAGGTGDPPGLPPRVYWQSDMRTVEGAAAVQSWFAGYRYGAQVAGDGGYRDMATVSVSASLKDCTPCGCPDEGDSGSCFSGCQLNSARVESAPAEPMPAEEIAPLESIEEMELVAPVEMLPTEARSVLDNIENEDLVLQTPELDDPMPRIPSIKPKATALVMPNTHSHKQANANPVLHKVERMVRTATGPVDTSKVSTSLTIYEEDLFEVKATDLPLETGNLETELKIKREPKAELILRPYEHVVQKSTNTYRPSRVRKSVVFIR